MTKLHGQGSYVPQRGGFRPGIARRALARDSKTQKYQTGKAIDGENYSLTHPAPAYLKGVNWGNVSKGAAIGAATLLLFAGLSGFQPHDGNASAEDIQDPCAGQPHYYGDGDWNVTYKEGERHRWFLQGVFGYSSDGDSIRLKTANPCTDGDPVSPIVYLKYMLSKDKVPNLEKLDKQLGCRSEYERGHSCDTGIDSAIDFDGRVAKVEKWEENIGENMYLDAINVSIEAEGPVNGIKTADDRKENSLVLPITVATVGLGLAVAVAYRNKKKKEYDSRIASNRQGKRLPPPSIRKQKEVVGSSEDGRPVYGDTR